MALEHWQSPPVAGCLAILRSTTDEHVSEMNKLDFECMMAMQGYDVARAWTIKLIKNENTKSSLKKFSGKVDWTG